MRHPGEDAPLTVEEFLHFEEHAEERHEFVGGRIYAMTGVTARHNLIAGNIYLRLRGLAGSGPCRVYIEGVQLRLPSDVFYPDVMVVCAPDGDDEKRANAPCLVVEVRSPSTGAIDLYGHKLHAYQALPSVLTYLVVEQERRTVVPHWRTSPPASGTTRPPPTPPASHSPARTPPVPTLPTPPPSSTRPASPSRSCRTWSAGR